MEIELKFLVDNKMIISEIFEDKYILSLKDKDSDEEMEMHAVYFDTADKRLFREGIAFRIRKEGNKIIATLKWNGSSEDGMHIREEINVPVDKESMLLNPDIHIFDLSEMEEILQRVVGERKLLPLMDVFFVRKQMRLDTGKCICELSVDQGEIKCEGKVEKISELELELYSGDAKDLKKLGAEIAEKYGLTPEDKSKYKRGLDLMK